MDTVLGINPLYFSLGLFAYLICFVFYLLLPRGLRQYYCGSYPKRYEWSAKPRRRRNPSSGAPPTGPGGHPSASSNALYRNPFHKTGSNNPMNNTNGNSNNNNGPTSSSGGSNRRMMVNNRDSRNAYPSGASSLPGSDYTGSIGSNGTPSVQQHQNQPQAPPPHSHHSQRTSTSSEDAALTTALHQLRDPGVLIVAHGSRGKPKTVRLQLETDCITWRTETRKKSQISGQYTKELKLGKLHSVALRNIMYVDVGKQTTALRRKENDSVPETLCFSLLTKEGSLDLEANSPRERDALVGCFSLVLDDVHAQNWRDIYRGPSDGGHGENVPSSFDEFDEEKGGGGRR